MRVVRALFAGVVVVAAACTNAAPVSPSPPASPVRSAPATPATSPPPGATPTPAATLRPTAGPVPAWQRLTTLNGVKNVERGLVGFSGGYVVLGEEGVFFSADGEAWTAVPNVAGTSIATDGRTVVIVGGYGHEPCVPDDGTTGGGPPCEMSPISWRSTDGRTWTSSLPWRGPPTPAGFAQGSEFMTAWAVPTGGWDATLAYPAGESSVAGGVFHSDDGLSWAALPSTPLTDLAGSPNPPEYWEWGAADQAGRRVVAARWYAGEVPVTRLFSTTDGRSWTELAALPGIGAEMSALVAPMSEGAPLWLVGGTTGSDPGTPTVWTSANLTSWTERALPMETPGASGWLSVLAATSDRYVVVGAVSDGTEDGTYDTSWVSADGIGWTQLPIPTEPGVEGPDMLADGPAGVIGISWVFDGGDIQLPSIVWALR